MHEKFVALFLPTLIGFVPPDRAITVNTAVAVPWAWVAIFAANRKSFNG
jgi:hypothetical protein